ncbi:MAG: aspartate--tRNA ligase, partial [Alphaproteobacteria bacterium]|nr:aspartate--tRNA ligase [Alphaproteobacteria bacterium]
GEVTERIDDTINTELATGEVEVRIKQVTVLSPAGHLPMPVNVDADYPEEIRLKYRFLDLRRPAMLQNILLRTGVIRALREGMQGQGFTEIQTPILTASSPEGARDFLVPSRQHPGKFYALPQAPQQFKQLLMAGGIDKYFQIAPCFRDEDARRDRSPGEFYQLDFEMAFATQEDVFNAIEPVLHEVFTRFTNGKTVTPYPFQRISFADAMLTYGSDKPDLRNPLRIVDVTAAFADSGFKAFANQVAHGAVVRAIRIPNGGKQTRAFFDKMNEWARGTGAAGLGYIQYREGTPVGPIAKHLSDDHRAILKQVTNIEDDDALCFACGPDQQAALFAGQARTELAERLELITDDIFHFCWIVDFPMFETNATTGKVDFSHNPFSMPQGGIEALNTQNPLDIKAWQYDIVCNGVELSSGAIRNHEPATMVRAFAIAGYDAETLEREFGGMLAAFRLGTPPHGGSAPGVDRMVMLLADTPNIREVTAFPMNQTAQDLLMGAPSEIPAATLKELGIKIL